MFMLPPPPASHVDVKPAPKRTASGTEFVASTHWQIWTGAKSAPAGSPVSHVDSQATIVPPAVSK